MVEAARLGLAAGQETGCDDDGVHRTGARAAESIKREVLLFEQAVQNAPGKCSKRAAPLESQRKAAASKSVLVNSHSRRGHWMISIQVGGGARMRLQGPYVHRAPKVAMRRVGSSRGRLWEWPVT